MTIDLEYDHTNNRWRADCKSMPGTPPVGCGNNVYEAVGILMAMLDSERDTWQQYFVTLPLFVSYKADIIRQNTETLKEFGERIKNIPRSSNV